MNVGLYVPELKRGAVISADQRYRYVLWRTWDPTLPRATYCMLNPSTADAMLDDMTIKKCCTIAGNHGYGAIDVINLFAYRATQPDDLITASGGNGLNWLNITGPDNSLWWTDIIAGSSVFIAAWGTWHDNVPAYARPPRGNPVNVARLFDVPVKCLGLTAGGAPKHPCRLANATELVPYDGL